MLQLTIKKYKYAAMLFLTAGTLIAAKNTYADCTNPCGVEELITCAAEKVNLTAEQFYNQKLFYSSNLDGFCKAPLTPDSTGLQQYYHNTFCTSASISNGYFSYQNFINAVKSTPFFAEFGCVPGTNAASRYKELANFLTTIAQETTSVIFNYKNDGLYFRYENGWLLGNDLSYKTPYYDNNVAPFFVATQTPVTSVLQSDLVTWTGNYWQGDPNNLSATIGQYNLQLPEQVVIDWVGGVTMPVDYPNATALGAIIDPGYWVGMGPKQLTGDSMMGFYGWYYFNIAQDAPMTGRNFLGFVNNYLVDGFLGFQGALWYWMKRTNGAGFKPIHSIVTNHNYPVCQDIAIVTRLVNGGCNNYNPGRVNYYKYFMHILGQKITPVIVDAGGAYGIINSMECTANLQQYCLDNVK